MNNTGKKIESHRPRIGFASLMNRMNELLDQSDYERDLLRKKLGDSRDHELLIERNNIALNTLIKRLELFRTTFLSPAEERTLQRIGDVLKNGSSAVVVASEFTTSVHSCVLAVFDPSDVKDGVLSITANKDQHGLITEYLIQILK